MSQYRAEECDNAGRCIYMAMHANTTSTLTAYTYSFHPCITSELFVCMHITWMYIHGYTIFFHFHMYVIQLFHTCTCVLIERQYTCSQLCCVQTGQVDSRLFLFLKCMCEFSFYIQVRSSFAVYIDKQMYLNLFAG